MTNWTPIDVTGRHVPEPLKSREWWVIWAPDMGKTPIAPWLNDHCYPTEWAADKADPRVSFEEAAEIAMQPVEDIAGRWPFPPDSDPSNVLPAVLLPPTEYDLAFVDLDDVIRDGKITTEAWAIIQRLGGYAEVSRSFNDPDCETAGVHVWVRGSLPTGHKKLIEPLDMGGQLEIYSNQARMTGGTWLHIDGTPRNAVPDAQEAIDLLVDEYADITEEPPQPRGDGGTDRAGTIGRGPKSAYYRLDVTDVADRGAFRSHRDGWRGPHPAHGGTSTPDRDSINFNVDPGKNVWHCFAHDSGGGALSLIAVIEGIVSCGRATEIHRDDDALLKTCLLARDKYATGLTDEKPPYAALRAVADMYDIPTADADAGILGKVPHRFALELYEEMDISDCG